MYLPELLVFMTAFHFCIEYKRRTEFRKLCDTVSYSNIFSHNWLLPVPIVT